MTRKKIHKIEEITEVAPEPGGPFRLPTILLVILVIFSFISPLPLITVKAEDDDKVEEETQEIQNFSFTNNYPSLFEQKKAALGVAIATSDIDRKQSEITDFYKRLDSKYQQILARRQKTDRLVAYLRAQGSPVATYEYANLIIEMSEKSGADHKVIVAIMGMESGFCAANYMKYNCFGFLNGIQYSGYTEAFTRLIPAIAKQYANVYGTNFSALATAYGVHNVPYHTARMHRYYNALL